MGPGREGVPGGGCGLELARVEEDDFVTELPVDLEDVLNCAQVGQVVDAGPEFFVDLAEDRVTVGLTQLDPAADKAVIALGMLRCRRVEADRVAIPCPCNALSSALWRCCNDAGVH